MRKPLSPINSTDIQCTQEGLKWLESVRSYMLDIRVAVVEVAPIAMNTNEITNLTVTVPGVKVGDIILEIVQTTFNTSFLVANGGVTADDTVTIQYHRGSGGGASYTPPTEDYTFVYIKNSRL
jgi:hypothetical protein